MWEDIIKNIDDPVTLIIGVILFWVGKYVDKWIDRRSKGKTKNPFNLSSITLKQLLIRCVADYKADKAFLILHNDEDNHYSIMHEYSPKLPLIEKDYQKVPYDDWALWAMGNLRKNGELIIDTLSECDNKRQKGIMEFYGMKSWYCFKLTYKSAMIGSLNLYYQQEYGLDEMTRDSLTGMISRIGNLLWKEIHEKY